MCIRDRVFLSAKNVCENEQTFFSITCIRTRTAQYGSVYIKSHLLTHFGPSSVCVSYPNQMLHVSIFYQFLTQISYRYMSFMTSNWLNHLWHNGIVNAEFKCSLYHQYFTRPKARSLFLDLNKTIAFISRIFRLRLTEFSPNPREWAEIIPFSFNLRCGLTSSKIRCMWTVVSLFEASSKPACLHPHSETNKKWLRPQIDNFRMHISLALTQA